MEDKWDKLGLKLLDKWLIADENPETRNLKLETNN